MQLFDLIAGKGSENLPRRTKELDMTPDEAAAVIRSVPPEISHYIERKTS